MKTFIKMAWRNIWRNKKRTLLTIFSIFIAVFLSLFTRSMQIGVYDNMISNAVKFSSGHIQIHKNGYWENKSLNEIFKDTKEIDEILKNNNNIEFYIPRIESYALASSGKHTKGSLVIGTDPEKENELNKYSQKIIKGDYLNSNDKAVVVAEKLAEYLNISVNDTIVMLGQGYHGITAAAQYKVKGIIDFPIPQLNNQLIIMPLAEAKYYYATDNQITSLSLMLKDADKVDATIAELKNSLNDEYEIMPWPEMNVELVQAIQSDSIGGIIMLGILYVVIGFGVFGTIMMMTMERKKEFAVMVSIGMQKLKILIVVIFETLFIGLVAVLLGILISYPILYYFYQNPIPLTGELAATYETFGIDPIIPFSINAHIFVNQTLTVIGITILAVFYPLSMILRFNIMKALRS
ncbi:MAG: ABC transporter permease [Ignavibacteriae bacterium]|nr:ABC transporter permease [Ignavibacteriota bacterium]MCB9209169.1 ABC transporter permease [Ignavibacteriales bacterium]MCB9219581.1 ABC transporter permease [Ignavibacteriales bacterium]MCB9257817.1 ABC transporter permease [Ignavibacteriales bacterium]